jgi:hypothetical protein
MEHPTPDADCMQPAIAIILTKILAKNSKNAKLDACYTKLDSGRKHDLQHARKQKFAALAGLPPHTAAAIRGPVTARADKS